MAGIRSGNWGSDLPLHQWHGVTTDDTGSRGAVWNCDPTGSPGRSQPRSAASIRLQRLDLGDNDIYGEIPAEIGDLTQPDAPGSPEQPPRQADPSRGRQPVEPGAPRPQAQRAVGGDARLSSATCPSLQDSRSCAATGCHVRCRSPLAVSPASPAWCCATTGCPERFRPAWAASVISPGWISARTGSPTRSQRGARQPEWPHLAGSEPEHPDR